MNKYTNTEGFLEHNNNIICCSISREVREGWWATAVSNIKCLSSTYDSHQERIYKNGRLEKERVTPIEAHSQGENY